MDSSTMRLGVGGAAVVGVAFGMARYAYGLTLPDVRAEFGLSELLLGLIASGTFVGYLVGLLCVPSVAARFGHRAPTTIGGLCGVAGAATVAFAPTPGLLAAGAVLAGSSAGWVWAPYSDIVTAVAPPRDRPTLLAVITTGTGGGLIGLGVLGIVGTLTSWRVAWAGIALAAAVAAVVNLRTVPRLPPEPGGSGTLRPPLRRSMVRPLAYAVVYFAACTIYFTYASDAVRSGGLGAAAGATLIAVLGVSGLLGLRTGAITGVLGSARTGAACLAVVGVSLALLALGETSLPLVLVSALLFGAAYMVGSAVLAIWTAEAVADRPGDGFTVALVVGAVSSIAAPAAVGAFVPVLGLSGVLQLLAAASALCGILLWLLDRLRPVAVPEHSATSSQGGASHG
ncbi:MFS transporter [Saccharomonospora halophila]|uniref:MFS transporter n=1 Tax=Saccharomonospora halophila TaxID=129922 RepID=UPI000368CA99|nr:MFS transporter [Saccharomonospora halophila]